MEQEKQIDLYSKNRIQLEDSKIRGRDYKVTFSVRNEFSEYVKNSEGKELKDMPANISEDNIWSAEFKIHGETKGKYLRLYFNITKNGVFVQSDFALVNLILLRQSVVQLIPSFYFKKYIVNGELDDDIKEKLVSYPDDGIQELLLSALSELSDELEMNIIPKTIDEVHDWYREDFSDTHLQTQLYEFPIIKINSFKMYYGNQLVHDFKIDDLTIDKEMGIIEYVQSPEKPMYLFSGTAVESLYFNQFSKGYMMNRLPGVYRVNYTHGVDFLNLDDIEQASYRDAACRRGMLKRLARISPEIITGGEMATIDGASYSKNSRGIEWLNMEKAAEKDWIFYKKRKHNKNVHGAIC